MADRSPPAPRKAFGAFWPVPLRWRDVDVYGHVNNAVHYALFDTAVNGWLMAQGLLDPGQDRAYFIVAETGCRYHAELRFPDPVEAGLRVTRLGTSSVTYQIGLFAGASDIAAAEGTFVHVYVSRGTHQPVPLPAPMRAKLGALVQD